MTKIYKNIRAENFNSLKSLLEPKGFKVRAFPLRERGINQPNYRKVEIVNPEQKGTMFGGVEQMRRSRSLREIDFSKF